MQFGISSVCKHRLSTFISKLAVISANLDPSNSGRQKMLWEKTLRIDFPCITAQWDLSGRTRRELGLIIPRAQSDTARQIPKGWEEESKKEKSYLNKR